MRKPLRWGLLNIKPEKSYKKEGKVKVVVESPVLLAGEYHLSIWMGDGNEDLFKDLNCLSFKYYKDDFKSNIFGFIKPQCVYNFI